MPVQGIQLALTSSPVVVAGDGTNGVIRVTVRNRGAGNVYLGSSGVTTSGYQLSTGDVPLQLIVQRPDVLWGCSTGTITVDVLRLQDTT